MHIPSFLLPHRAHWRLLLHVLCGLPAPVLLWALLRGELAPDPAKVLILETGETAIRLLLLCLSVSPIYRLTNLPGLILWRRPLGLWAAAWTLTHAGLFAVLYVELSPQLLWQEIVERPYISVGFAALLILLPLAATSNRAAMRRLRHNWRRLHSLVYLAGGLAVLHLVWQIREEWGEAFFYSGWLLLLLGERLVRRLLAARQPDTGLKT